MGCAQAKFTELPESVKVAQTLELLAWAWAQMLASPSNASISDEVLRAQSSDFVQAKYTEPLPENAKVAQTLELLAKYEGGLVSGTSSGKDFTADEKGELRKVCFCLPAVCHRTVEVVAQLMRL